MNKCVVVANVSAKIFGSFLMIDTVSNWMVTGTDSMADRRQEVATLPLPFVEEVDFNEIEHLEVNIVFRRVSICDLRPLSIHWPDGVVRLWADGATTSDNTHCDCLMANYDKATSNKSYIDLDFWAIATAYVRLGRFTFQICICLCVNCYINKLSALVIGDEHSVGNWVDIC